MSGGKPKLFPSGARKFVRMFWNNSGPVVAQHCHELETAGPPVSQSTVKPVLHLRELRRPRKKPIIQNQHLQAHLKFAAAQMNKPNAFWRSISWSEETKIELFGLDERRYICRS